MNLLAGLNNERRESVENMTNIFLLAFARFYITHSTGSLYRNISFTLFASDKMDFAILVWLFYFLILLLSVHRIICGLTIELLIIIYLHIILFVLLFNIIYFLLLLFLYLYRMILFMIVIYIIRPIYLIKQKLS